MTLLNTKFLKTVACAAVFCFLASLTFAAAPENSLEIVKKKAVNLLIQSQKKQAISILSEYIAKENNRNFNKDAREYRLKVAKKFLTKDAQEAYEMSLNLTLENPKAAKKNNDDCLSRDPENLDCLTQKARLSYRDKRAPLKADELEHIAKYFENGEINWIKLSSEKTNPEFKSLNFFKKEGGPVQEARLPLVILELERSLAAKNFSKAKELLSLIETTYVDWPETIYFKNKIDLESSETIAPTTVEFMNQYQNKCKNLSKTIVRKYRYDFELCLRGL